jgi:hypothetical protein
MKSAWQVVTYPVCANLLLSQFLVCSNIVLPFMNNKYHGEWPTVDQKYM